MKVSIGIDIGADGGYCVIDDHGLHYGKIPRVADGEIDLHGLAMRICPNEDDMSVIVIEDLHSVFGSSAKSNFEFGKNNGLIIGMIQMLQIPYLKVAPKKWQKEMWEGIRPVEIPVKGKTNKDGSQKYKIDTKATSLIAARRLFPKETFLATERSKVPHDGIVDAVLIAEYARRKNL